MKKPSRHATALEKLVGFLTPYYTLPKVSGGHDVSHVKRMIAMGPRIQSVIPGFEPWEFETAVWLHNIDRSPELKEKMEAAGGIEAYCLILLEESAFPRITRHRIAVAVRKHSKKLNAPGDPPLLLALRTADMMDRFSAVGALAIGSFRGQVLPAYDEDAPFGFPSEEEDQLKTLYHDFLRVTQWYQRLPSDVARALVPRKKFLFFLDFVRQFAEEIAENTRKENGVEDDLRQVLGPYYEEYAPNLV